MAEKKRGLGRGLDALISVDETPVAAVGGQSINEIEIAKIEANPNQPRTNFDEDALNDLAESIRNVGIITPITLHQLDAERYQIIAGERRWRAAKMAGLDKIPAYVRTTNDEQQVQMMALIENIQREDLNAIEIALSYNNLIEQFNLTQEELSQRVGKKRATIANYVRLLRLPADIQLALRDRKIEMGHARAIAGAEDTETKLLAFARVMNEHLSVRATEELVAELQKAAEPQNGENQPAKSKRSGAKSAQNEQLTNLIGAETQISTAANGSGKIIIKFASADDLQRIVETLGRLAN